MASGHIQTKCLEDNMGLFSKKEITWEEVLEFIKSHGHEITDAIAEEIMINIVKSKSNKVLFYRVDDDNV